MRSAREGNPQQVGTGQCELLMQWKGLSVAEVTWIDLAEFQQLYPSFQLEDELLVEEGRDVMLGKQYSRRRRGKQSTKDGGSGR
jgi:hypothetical protein